MATSNQSEFRTSFSFTQDSDDIHEMHCEHCDKLTSKYAPAEAFCVECMEYMCGHCIKYHNLYMSAHTIQDKQSMPQDFCFEKCSDHPNQIIKFYCTPCDKIACSECKANNHNNCSNLSHLPTIVKHIEQSRELKHLMFDMNNVSKELDEIGTRIHSNLQSVDLQETNAKSTIKKHKEKILGSFKTYQKETIENFDKNMEEIIAKLKKERQEMVDQLADKQKKLDDKVSNAFKDVTQKVENCGSVDKKNMKALKTKNMTFKGDLKILSSDLVQNQTLGHRCKLFIAMKLAHTDVDRIKQEVSKLKGNNNIKHYKVEPNEIDSKLETLHMRTNFFTFEDIPLKDIPKSMRKRIAAVHTHINIKELTLSSLCLLSENTLLVTDWDGSSLLIYKDIQQNNPSDIQQNNPSDIQQNNPSDIQQNNPSFETMKMSSSPWDITKIKDDKVAVILPQQGIIRLMTFSKSMSVIKCEDIKAVGTYRGIAYTGDSLIVSYSRPARIQILDMFGNVIKTLDILDSSKKPLFSDPHYLTLSPDNTIIYVSDCDRHTVTSLTIDGTVKAVYSDSQLRHPYQLTVDESGAVYVCGMVSQNVHQLSPDLNKVRILLDSRQGIQLPMSIAYCNNSSRLYVGSNNRLYVESNSRLYVGSGRSSTITVFNISLE